MRGAKGLPLIFYVYRQTITTKIVLVSLQNISIQKPVHEPLHKWSKKYPKQLCRL